MRMIMIAAALAVSAILGHVYLSEDEWHQLLPALNLGLLVAPLC